ncbi:lysophospholipid acyltransferase family protein [Cognatiyoonia sp. IB215182]|uniref:lysophospholipid acyltransferase family protein n=1 Tax=Cognatiyoonia sp. IB215182 TaxID=3097353 RepID=UPI002A0EA0C5|nr:DUF374 domain-containing protein [Cognatiyoonia sp. IB215182]MDX8354101.1 DUF374 domain-containing protein [Cognatiyoonia sp. IB215182]
MKFRRRLKKSETLAIILGFVARLIFGICYRTTRWQGEGRAELEAALAEGPVILVVWHSRLLLGPAHWPLEHGQLSSIHTRSPIGRVVGAMQRQQGLHPFEMKENRSNRATSRQIMKLVQQGTSIGITADGPEGPALQLKDPPIDWARATGLPVFCYAYATKRQWRAKSWDQMLIPLPFTRGAYVYARFEETIPRKMDAAKMDALRTHLQDFMVETTARADEMLGLPRGP